MMKEGNGSLQRQNEGFGCVAFTHEATGDVTQSETVISLPGSKTRRKQPCSRVESPVHWGWTATDRSAAGEDTRVSRPDCS